jgi:polysaccharide pyruvyl transferase CsaB
MDNNRTKRIAISGGDSWVNSGDQAILSGTLQLFSELESDIEITIISGDKQKSIEQFPCYKVVDRKNIIQLIKAIKSVDILLWGGGHLLQNTSSQLFLVYQFFLISIGIILKKKVIAFCIGAEKINGRFWRWLSKQVLNKFDLISVRDDYSLEVVKSMNLDVPILLSADPAVILEPDLARDKNNAILPKKPYMIFSLRKWFDYRSSVLPVKFQRRFSKGESDRFLLLLKVFTQICDWITGQHGMNIYFIPMYIENEQNDNVVASQIRNGMLNKERAYIIDQQLSPKELLDLIKDAEILVGMRMHSTILGACASVPIVGLYYQQKGRTFFEALGLDDLMIDIEQVSFENLSSMIAGVLSDRDKIIHRLQDNLPLQRNKVRETVKYFKEEYFQR